MFLLMRERERERERERDQYNTADVDSLWVESISVIIIITDTWTRDGDSLQV